MKKIDEDAACAFYSFTYFKRSNTLVASSLVDRGIYCNKFFLFGNQIAEAFLYDETRVLDLYVTTARWNTLTTRARLNAILNPLGKTVFVLDGQLYFYDIANRPAIQWDGNRINIYRGPMIPLPYQ